MVLFIFQDLGAVLDFVYLLDIIFVYALFEPEGVLKTGEGGDLLSEGIWNGEGDFA